MLHWLSTNKRLLLFVIVWPCNKFWAAFVLNAKTSGFRKQKVILQYKLAFTHSHTHTSTLMAGTSIGQGANLLIRNTNTHRCIVIQYFVTNKMTWTGDWTTDMIEPLDDQLYLLSHSNLILSVFAQWSGSGDGCGNRVIFIFFSVPLFV